MLRQVSSRNHRSKGFKLKNALQLCLLVVVTIWLLYQVKHSYDKKTRYEEHNAHLSIKHDDGDGEGDGDRRRRDVFKLPGRKDLPRTVGRTEDEESEDDELLEQELLNSEESDERDAIDEQDHPESEEADGDEPSVFEDAESGKEGAHAAAAAREESFRRDDAASAVVVRAGRPEEHGDHSREAREKSFNGDNVSSAVAHEDHLESAENKAAGGENLTVVDSTSDRTSEFSSGDGGGSKDREVSSNSTVDEPNNHAEPRVDPTTTDVVGNQTATPAADQEVREKPMNTTTTAWNNQIELLTNLTVPEQNETTNLGSGSARDGSDAVIQIPGDDQFNTSSTTSSASSEKGERKVEFQDTTRNMADEMRDVPNAKIEERAKSGEEVVLE